MSPVQVGEQESVAGMIDSTLSAIESEGFPGIETFAKLRDLLKQHPGAIDADRVRRTAVVLVDAVESGLGVAEPWDGTLFRAAWEPLEVLLTRRLRHDRPAVDETQLRRVAERLLDLAESPQPREIDPKQVWKALRTLLQKRLDGFSDTQLTRVVALTPDQYKTVGEAGDELVTVTVTVEAAPLRHMATAELRRRARLSG